MLEPALKKIHSFVREMYPLHWLICHVNTFECLEGMVGRKSMSVSMSEILVQYTGVQRTSYEDFTHWHNRLVHYSHYTE